MRGGMIRWIAIFLMLTAIPAGLLGQKGLDEPARLVIEGATLIDGTGRPPLRNAVVVIEGNKITAVGEKGKVSPPGGARVMEAAGKFILPGFIDAHVHWRGHMPEMFLAYGVTSVVDLNTGDWQVQQKEAIADGRLQGPRLFLSTQALTGRLLWDVWMTRQVDGPEMVRRLIREAGPGRQRYAVGKGYTELTPDQLRALTEESHKAGRMVIAHLGSLDARQAAELGVDAIAHTSGVALATITDPVKADELRSFVRLGIAVDFPSYLMYHAYMDPAKVDALIQLLVEKKVRMETDFVNTSGRWVPKYREVWKAEDARVLQDPGLAYIPADQRDKNFYYDPWDRLTLDQQQLVAQGWENLKSFLRKFVQAGGKVMLGTDSSSFVITGLSFHREMELLVEAGLTPMQAIQAATKNNAEFLQEELGTVEPGKLADLILVRQDPLANIKNTRTIDMVIKDGEVLDTRYHPDFANPLPSTAASPPTVHPVPFISAIYPITSKEPNKEVKLTIEGSNFAEKSVVEFDGAAVPTTPVKSTMLRQTIFNPIYTQLTATVPARLLNRVGTYKVRVKTPRPQGGTSNVLFFFVAK